MKKEWGSEISSNCKIELRNGVEQTDSALLVINAKIAIEIFFRVTNLTL